jgi:cytochrome c oxidase cbb3-type subunit III
MKRFSRKQIAWLSVSAVGLAAYALMAAMRHERLAAVVRANPEDVLTTPQLRSAALAIGRKVFADHCATCHGRDARGNHSLGVPDLTDADFLYGEGRVSEIEDIVRHGIRSHDKRGWDLASMPAYATAKPYAREAIEPLSPSAIEELTQFLLSFTGRDTDSAAALRGGALFRDKGGCWDCHQPDATGDPAIGAPNLTDSTWLYGDGSHQAIYQSIADGRAGFSPAFARTLDALEARSVAVFVASLPARQLRPDARK